MSKRKDIDYVCDIMEAAKRVTSYCQGVDYDQFFKDKMIQDAVVRNIEIIGEAAKSLSKEFIQKNPHVSWSDLARARDKLIHHYFGVNLDIIWSIVEESIPQLQIELAKIIKASR